MKKTETSPKSNKTPMKAIPGSDSQKSNCCLEAHLSESEAAEPFETSILPPMEPNVEPIFLCGILAESEMLLDDSDFSIVWSNAGAPGDIPGLGFGIDRVSSDKMAGAYVA